MAVPTITSVTPEVITTIGGSQIVILGTNFAVPTDPMSGPGPIPWPTPALAESVRLRLYSSLPAPAWSYTFEKVLVASSTKIKVNVPSLYLPRDPTAAYQLVNTLTLTVEVTNLDTLGVPVPGEIVTFSSVLLRRPLLAGPDAKSLTRSVTANVINHLSQIVPNVSNIPDTDYDSDTFTEFIRQAPSPALVVLGPMIVPSIDGRAGFESVEANPTPETYTRTHPLPNVDYAYTILGVSNNASELQNMMSALMNGVLRFGTLTVHKDPVFPDLSTAVVLDIGFTLFPKSETQIQELSSNLRLFKAELVVYSVPAVGVDSAEEDAIVESGGILGMGGSGSCAGDSEHVDTGTGVELCVSDFD